MKDNKSREQKLCKCLDLGKNGFGERYIRINSGAQASLQHSLYHRSDFAG